MILGSKDAMLVYQDVLLVGINQSPVYSCSCISKNTFFIFEMLKVILSWSNCFSNFEYPCIITHLNYFCLSKFLDKKDWYFSALCCQAFEPPFDMSQDDECCEHPENGSCGHVHSEARDPCCESASVSGRKCDEACGGHEVHVIIYVWTTDSFLK